ncbi:MAG: hypothetical protein K0S71_1441 [Clostridia bacterium]|jgi:prepilin-type N-terminal cleavage/methylation domain-containing protein|nr:hypothetical protein [Clostridia bacterium]
MKKDLNSKGFTLIEVIVALLLFSLLMGALWEFFGNTYSVYTQFDHKTNLSDESRRVSSFIREEIRLADQVTITVEGSPELKIHPPETPKTMESSSLVKDKQLAKIELKTAGSGRKGDRRIELSENASFDNGEGLYKLVYIANSTSSLISDKIQNIKVTREEDSPIVVFECTISKKGETQAAQIVQHIFSESLEYKAKY